MAFSPIRYLPVPAAPSQNATPSGLEAVVMGRTGVDLYPMQLETPLEDVEGFH